MKSLATERLVVPISPDDKRRVEARAKRFGQSSTAEFVRRAALNYDPGEAVEEAELRLLLAELDRVHEATVAQLDRTDRTLDAVLAQLAGRK
ncbi:MAG TPA: hypothetical protein VKS60_11360 [Stellaceae bacterium]|nr:hypothetical protein [Stellaceae bacterium]